MEWRTFVHGDEVFYNYEVSTNGDFRNKKTGQILEQQENNCGYLTIRLRRNGKQRRFLSHRVVGFVFIPNDNPTIKTEIHHKNHDRHDNRVENLEWINPTEHAKDEESIKKRAESKSKNVICVETGEILSVEQWAKRLNVSKTTVTKTCRKGQKTCKGLHLEYVD